MHAIALCDPLIITFLKKLFEASPRVNIKRVMKLAAAIILLGCLTASAHGHSQGITLNKKNATLDLLFFEINKQTGYNFLYKDEWLKNLKTIDIDVQNASLEEVLSICFKDQPFTYTIINKTIVVREKENKAETPRVIISSILPVEITGKVTDSDGKPLAGANVRVKGGNIGTTTDSNGVFRLRGVDANSTIEISFVGFETQSISVKDNASITVILKKSEGRLEEVQVVTVGYQTARRGDLSGAVSIVNVAGMTKLPVGTVDQALQGKAPGVRVTQNTGQPGEGVSVRIRGVGTINDNNPLYIIDGVPTKDGINFLSPNDIESLVVLKDASSAAIYGARASNGVVVITTKGGRKGKPQFTYSGYEGVQVHGDLPEMLNTQKYVEIYNEAVDNDNADISNPALKRKPIPAGMPMANTNWLDEILQTAPIRNHQLSVRGGNDKTLYYISGNYFRQDGIILNSWFERYSLQSKLNTELSSNLNLAYSINLSYSKKNKIGSSGDGYGGNGGSVVRYALFRTPPIPVYDSTGLYSDLPAYPNFFGDGYNPVALAQKTDNKEQQYRVFTNLYLEYKITDKIKFKTDAGIDAIITDNKRYDENYGTNLRINSPSRLTVGTTDNFNFVWNNTIRYNQVFNKVHSVNFIVGTEAISNNTKYHEGTDNSFPDQLSNLRYLNNGLSTSKTVYESQQEWALFSLFGNVNYVYDNRYLFSVNARRDGSSRFGPENKYGNFYSGSVGWNLHNETWVQEHLSVFSKLKLRGSFGQLGNQDIGNYAYASIIGRGYNYPFGEQPVSNQGYTVSVRGNEKVKWEASNQGDVGLDMGIWKNRLTLTADYFVKTTSDMLIPIPLPVIGGTASAPYVNAGKVQNSGFEFELNYANHDHALSYDVNLNFATLANKVLSLSNGEPIPGGRIDNGVYATLTTVGQPIGSFYLYKMDGIFQNPAEVISSAYQGSYIRPGDVKFTDVNGDGIINEQDRTFLGSSIPKFTYGATANFGYKNFDLSIFFQGANGNKLYLQVNQDIEGFYRAFNVTQRVYDERWHGEGTSNSMPRVSWLGSTNNKTPSSRFLEDGSYVRLKNIQLGYTIPDKIVNRWHIKSLRIYFTGQNLLTFTKYTGLDPEMTTSDNLNAETYRGDLAAGIDWGTYPSAKSYIVGVNLNF
jgi:TonB-dependent starch-binding outer membrane protein SusC